MMTGTPTLMKIGVEIEMTTKMATTLKNIQIQFLMTDGNRASITSVSLENRFIIRPNGVVSKNDIGSLIVFFKSPLCKFRADLKAPTAKITAEVRSATPKSRIVRKGKQFNQQLTLNQAK